MLRLYRSNRTEALLEVLAALLNTRCDGDDPMRTEEVIIPVRGYERWLTQKLSERLGVGGGAIGPGIAANIRFPFPARVVSSLVSRALGEDETPRDLWECDTLVWAIDSVLDGIIDAPVCEPLRRFLGERESDQIVDDRRYALVVRIADLFDRYATFRPHLARQWSLPADRISAASEDWQPLLWNTVQRHLDATVGARHAEHRAARGLRAIERFQLDDAIGGLPPRLFLFGVTSLPPLYLEVLRAAARKIEIHLLLMTPSHTYWADIQSRRSHARAIARGESDLESLGAPCGNPLLASFGRMGRDFQVVLEGLPDDDPYVDSPTDLFIDSEEETVLSTLQTDVLHARGATERSPRVLHKQDDSLRIHSAHSPIRQVQILRDELLRIFDDAPDIEPRDVLVMSPRIEAYAPLITAVFGESWPPREDQDALGFAPIPYQITDRSLREENPLAAALMKILAMAESRAPLSGVMELLSLNVIRERFGFAATDVTTLRQWLVEAGARWGIDKAHRAEVLGTELAHETTLNTMAFAFERLVLGVAMQGEDDVLFQGSAPFDGVEGDLIELVGKGVHFWTTLQRWLRSLRTATTLEQWQGFCEAILESMTQAPEGQDWLHQQVRDAIATVVAQATEVGFDAKITLGTLKDLLTGRFDLQGSSQGPTAGAVTFCAMVPMRSIPHRVVVLLGVDDEIFPRRPTSLAFDRIATQRRPGDRDARDEDRALFLESLLAARDHLIITYTGRDPISNEPRPPAVPLSELMDAIDQSMVQEDALATEPPHKLVLREHPTQAFSPRNFGPDPKSARSYDRALARCLLVPPRETRVFRGAPLPEHPDQTIADSEVSLTALNRFLKNPSAIFLRDRLKVSLENRDAVLEDRETMSASSLLNWQIEDRLLNAYLETPDAAPQDERLSRAQAGLLASGDLPHGVAAQDAIINARQKALRVLQYVQSEVLTEPIEAGQSLNLKVQLGHTHIVGTLTHVYGEGQLMITCAKARPKRVLEAWLRHLALTLHDGGRSLSTTLIAYDKDDNPSSMRFPAVEANSHAIRAHLEAIVRLRTEGYRTPIPFFMDTSYAYYKSLCAQPDKPHKIALETMNKWNDGYQHAGEGADPYHRLLYAPRGPVEDSVPTGHDDVDAAFRALSETIWGPIAEALGGALP